MKVSKIKMGIEVYVPHPNGVQYVNRKPYFEIEGELQDGDDVHAVRGYLSDQLRRGIAEMIHIANQDMTTNARFEAIEARGQEMIRPMPAPPQAPVNPVSQLGYAPVDPLGYAPVDPLGYGRPFPSPQNGQWQGGTYPQVQPMTASAPPAQQPQHQPSPPPDTSAMQASVFEEPFYAPQKPPIR